MVFVTLSDAQKLQFDLAPPAARREIARGAADASSDIVNAIVARISPNVPVDSVAESVRRWKHLAALTQDEQETILTRSVIERARRRSGCSPRLLLIVSTVIIALIIYTLTIDKMKEIATLKLIGAPDRTIVGLIVQQALAMGAIGFGLRRLADPVDQGPLSATGRAAARGCSALGAVVFVVCLVASSFGVRLRSRSSRPRRWEDS